MPLFSHFPHSCLHNRLNSLIISRKSQGLLRHRRVVASPQSSKISIGERELLNFCSNDYLGLANDRRIKTAFKAGVDKWGVGSGASHLVCGHTSAHHELEEALADFLGRESALLFSSGYAANVGVINGLLNEGDTVFQDRLNHASLLDGGWISRAKHQWYQHGNYVDLNNQLINSLSQNHISNKRNAENLQLIVSDGVFSMDGDQCDVEQIVTCAKNNNAVVMIDDAHGIGCLGRSGTGSVDPDFFSSADIPVLVGTLGKAFGTSGAFVAGDHCLIEFLLQRARNYIYSTAMPSALAVASLESLHIVKEESWRREKLTSLIAYFKQQSCTLNLPLTESHTAIQPIIIGSAEQTSIISQRLELQGILVSAIRPPTVPDNTSRLRVTLTANHSTDDIDRLLSTLFDSMHDLEAGEKKHSVKNS